VIGVENEFLEDASYPFTSFLSVSVFIVVLLWFIYGTFYSKIFCQSEENGRKTCAQSVILIGLCTDNARLKWEEYVLCNYMIGFCRHIGLICERLNGKHKITRDFGKDANVISLQFSSLF
jgi:hypothetical protein